LGRTRILPGQAYPALNHPEDRTFSWERGRVINALQLVLISQGRGEIEWRTRHHTLKSGDAFILLPGVWHRYRPDPKFGWTEEWFEVRGTAVDSWVAGGLLDFSPASMLGNKDFYSQLRKMQRVCASPLPGARAIAAGIAMTLLATMGARQESERDDLSALIQQAQGLLIQNISVPTVAQMLGISYITFYRQFKKALGLSPRDYIYQIRLSRAENFLTSTNMTIKEIADRLGYYSVSHFTQEFKKTKGKPPGIWREESARERQLGKRCAKLSITHKLCREKAAR